MMQEIVSENTQAPRAQRNIRLIVAYDGTELHGYQRQANGFTVQQALEEALSKVCNEPIVVYGASRTDAGVHAKFQVVTFFTSGNIPIANLKRALISHMPSAIVIKQADELPLDWKPRWSIVGKQYVYTIHNGETEDPLSARYHWFVTKSLDISNMQAAARLLEGTHDFTTFQGKGSTPANPVKTLYKVAIIVCMEKVYIHVFGNGFLYHMVRNIAGLLVDIGLGRRQVEDVLPYIQGKERSLIGKTAPAKGLCLERVFFEQKMLLDAIDNCRKLEDNN